MHAHTLGAGLPRAWTDDSHAEWDREARSYGPDDDGDGDGETDTLYGCDPDDEDTQEIIVQPMPGPLPTGADDYDDDRRRAADCFNPTARMGWWDGYRAGRNGDRLASGTQAYADGYDAGVWELQRIETAALADYDSWLTCAEWDALEQLGRAVGGPVSFDGGTAYVPASRFVSPSHRDGWLYFHGLHRLPHTECVFGGGLAVRIKGAAQ